MNEKINVWLELAEDKLYKGSSMQAIGYIMLAFMRYLIEIEEEGEGNATDN